MLTSTLPQKPQKQPPRAPVIQNRRARHEYHIHDTLVAGIVLAGVEVKSLRAGRANLSDAFARVEHGEVWLYNLHISPWAQGSQWNGEPTRRRKLLLHRAQIEQIRVQSEQKGRSIVPLKIFFDRGFAKLEIAIAEGKKLHDKRESIAEKDRLRESAREAARGGRDG
ncbi:MAG: SsrA-binding protein SmpB [Armatimonadetes bacterium]|nr:SsrA-binding protein SmpB [Armatimonadota bacterium]MDE2205681.1 SsrA-binding protein SmpB [Armatimonadota bacterium]